MVERHVLIATARLVRTSVIVYILFRLTRALLRQAVSFIFPSSYSQNKLLKSLVEKDQINLPKLPRDLADALRLDYLQGLETMCGQCKSDMTKVTVAGEEAILVTSGKLCALLLANVVETPCVPAMVAPCVGMLKGGHPLIALNGAEWYTARYTFANMLERCDETAVDRTLISLTSRLSSGTTVDALDYAKHAVVGSLVSGLGRLDLSVEKIKDVVSVLDFFIAELPRRAYSADPTLREDYLSPTPSNVELTKNAALLLTSIQGVQCDPQLLAEALISAYLPQTTGIVMSLYFVARNPTVMQALHKDVHEMLLSAVVWETLRLCPPFPVLARESLDQSLDLDGVHFPAHSKFWIPTWWLGRSKVWGSDAAEFRPMRWLDAKSPLPPGAMLAFGHGRRDCPGRQVAVAVHKAALKHVLCSFRLKYQGPGSRMTNGKMPCAFTGVGIRPFDGELVKVGMQISLETW